MRQSLFALFCGLTLASALPAAPAWGHPGHGTTDPDSIAHVAEPIHAGPIVATVIAGVVASVVGWKVARKRR